MKNALIRFGLISGLSIGLLSASFSAAPPPKPGQPGSDGSNVVTGTTAANCAIGVSRAELDINNVRTRYLTAGDMFWDPAISQARYEVPKRTDNLTTSRNSIFAAAIWLGGEERGTNNILVMVQTYRGSLRNYWPGPIQYTNQALAVPTNNKVCSAWDQHFKCNRRTVKEFVDQYEAGAVDCDKLPQEIKFWPGKGNPYLKQKAEFAADQSAVASVDNNLANFFDRDSNGVYNPCNGDYPLWAGTEIDNNCPDGRVDINAGADQVIWWVCNDAGNKKNFDNNTTTVPEIGIEVHYEAFAYASTDATNDMTFLRQKIYNKGSYILDKTYLAQWVDPDLGNAGDDYVGCDVLRGLGICYNGDENDEGASGYGENPPAVGVDFFRGPFPDDHLDNVDWDLDCAGPANTPPDTNERITMSGFVYYNIGGNPRNGDPTKFTDFYNYLQNKWKDGTNVTWDDDGTKPDNPKASHMFPNPMSNNTSDPYGFACGAKSCSEPIECPKNGVWNEVSAKNAPGDRRFLANNGPFTLQPGDFNECTIGIVWARASSGGPTGSFGKLLAADDLAQERFNDCFKRNIGPNSPNLEIIEYDKDLVFTIIPDTIVRNPLMTTETYKELDRRVSIGSPANPQDVEYKFQGYKIYQLSDDKVSVQDLSNPDKARFLEGDVNGDGSADFTGLMDVQDGVTSINNLLYNADFDADISTPMVKNPPDKGIFKSFKVNKDMFNPSGTFSNFKKYYYAIVAYGFIRNNQEKRPYIQGVSNYKVYTAIPHRSNPESFGTNLNFEFGAGIPITRINGVGNSGNILELQEGEEEKVLQDNLVQKLTYKAGSGPIDIKIYNPKAVKGGNFEVKFSSRLRYKPTNYFFNVGDVIVADPTRKLDAGFNTFRDREEFKPATATVRRVLNATDINGFYDLDVDLDCSGGTFIYYQDQVEVERNQFVLRSSKKTGLKFRLQSDTSKAGIPSDFVKYDYWTLTGNGISVMAEKPVSAVSEQIIPELGISLRPKNVADPGTDITNPLSNNGALPSSIILDLDPLKFWTYGVSTSSYPWYRGDPFNSSIQYYALDPKRSYQNFAGAGWLPYVLTERASFTSLDPLRMGGPQLAASTDSKPEVYFDADGAESLESLSQLQNVNIVFTADKSKWTRCSVIQCDSIPASSSTIRTKYTMAKSRQLSVNKDYAPDNSVSTFDPSKRSKGMSWFPGYAVDLDRGMRLNMMFSESYFLDTSSKGNDLQWEPRASFGGLEGYRNFIFVLKTKYDEGVSTEFGLDSLYTKNVQRTTPVFLPMVRKWNLKNIMYAGLMGRGIDFVNRTEHIMNLTDVRIRLRVDKAFNPFSHSLTSGDCNPLYGFSIDSKEIRNVISVAKSALDMIRVSPNPYYSQSTYENSQVDNRVKIVNLPTQCVVSIFNLTGTLVRQYNFDQSSTKPYAAVGDGIPIINSRGANYQTFLDWDLKNQNGIPIASGVYIIHVKSDKLGEKTIKWFGVLRPIDLDTFN